MKDKPHIPVGTTDALMTKTRKLHASELIGHLQFDFKRLYGPNIYIVRARDGQISTSRLYRVICDSYIECCGMLWLEAR